MKAHLFGCTFLISLALHAQVSTIDELTRAAHLNEVGRFSEALQITEPLMASSASSPDVVAGVAWNIRGLALENLGELDRARRSYETSIEILRATHAPVKQYASALNNLGSLKADLGDFEESLSLRLRALKLYRSISDHAGAARTSVNLALLALAQRDRKRTRRFIAEAQREMTLVANPNASELAALYNVEAVEDAREGRLNEALHVVDQALHLWTESYGSQYYLIATGLCLRGQIHSASKSWDEAQADLVRALDILSINHAVNSKAYFIAERNYATVLRQQGDSNKAEKLAGDAKRGLEGLQAKQCTGCSVSVEKLQCQGV